MFDNTYNGKTVLVTGHTGFKGSWLALWLQSLGANVVGVSREVLAYPSNYVVSKVSSFSRDFFCDVRDVRALADVIKDTQPDFIFHLAAQALVRPSYEKSIETFSTNALGPLSVLEAIRKSELSKLVSVVLITSDKVYDNVEWKWGYRETDPLGGKDPYSASKGMAEIGIRSFISSFFENPRDGICIGIARAGNVIGGGDWAQDRVVPDCVKAWSQDEIVNIRSPEATRPWQHVLEPLSGYLLLGAELTNKQSLHGEAYNFGPEAHNNFTIRDLISEMSNYWQKVKWSSPPVEGKRIYEAGLLKLNCDKALFDLSWQPTLDFCQTVRMTSEWYKKFYQDENEEMFHTSLDQINEYSQLARQCGFRWACNG